MNWQTLVSSAVVAACVAALLNSFVLLWRDRRDRVRQGKGMLQRARSATQMAMEAVKESLPGSQLSFNESIDRLREIMLSIDL